ncbi:MAG: hypothetical protein HQL01_12245 [Nitrospirae bacterium]|nr:hypothetical protein [Nitrospirota bacterium]
MKNLFSMKEKEPVNCIAEVAAARDTLYEDRVNADVARLEKSASVIFKRLDKSVKILEAIEASVDAKITHLERLLQMADAVSSSDCGQNRRFEVLALRAKGLGIDEIATILGIQHGEIELILNLNR